eukprot:6194649-Pleurochrysis_carterae.AAC.3
MKQLQILSRASSRARCTRYAATRAEPLCLRVSEVREAEGGIGVAQLLVDDARRSRVHAGPCIRVEVRDKDQDYKHDYTKNRSGSDEASFPQPLFFRDYCALALVAPTAAARIGFQAEAERKIMRARRLEVRGAKLLDLTGWPLVRLSRAVGVFSHAEHSSGTRIL